MLQICFCDFRDNVLAGIVFAVIIVKAKLLSLWLRLLCNRRLSCEIFHCVENASSEDFISTYSTISLRPVLHPIMSCNVKDMSSHIQWNKWDLLFVLHLFSTRWQ